MDPKAATIARAVAQVHSEFVDAMRSTALYLEGIADTVDGWATQSRSGGWSTHQVAANEALANDCRRRAAQIRQIGK